MMEIEEFEDTIINLRKALLELPGNQQKDTLRFVSILLKDIIAYTRKPYPTQGANSQSSSISCPKCGENLTIELSC